MAPILNEFAHFCKEIRKANIGAYVRHRDDFPTNFGLDTDQNSDYIYFTFNGYANIPAYKVAIEKLKYKVIEEFEANTLMLKSKLERTKLTDPLCIQLDAIKREIQSRKFEDVELMKYTHSLIEELKTRISYEEPVDDYYLPPFNIIKPYLQIKLDACDEIIQWFKAQAPDSTRGMTPFEGKENIHEQKPLTFQYTVKKGKFTNLTNFKQALKNFIEPTDNSDFRAIFSEGPIKSKICWKGELKELAYLIFSLYGMKDKIDVQYPWEAAKACFCLPGGKPLPDSIRTYHKTIHPPKRHSEIDRALRNL